MALAQNSAAEFELSEQQVARLIGVVGSFRDRVILKLLYFCGLRRTEVCGLDTSDIDYESCRLVIRNGKGSKSRIVPASAPLLADLKALSGRRRTGPLVVSARGGRLSERSINYLVAQAGRKGQVRNPNPRRTNINPHLLRHSFARHYLRHGGRLHILSQILGHASIATTHAIYGTASVEDISNEYQRIFGSKDGEEPRLSDA